MKDAYVTIHGHFYQPPRENPWLETIETEESAHPFHDWNERIALECYRPNAYARIMDGKGKILDIFNNYSSISFNFGPTLVPWLEKHHPFVYQRILEADRESLRRFGNGNAIAQVYHHIIMPLANRRDKETEVFWGIADFEKRFHRKPEAMWLPETAVDYPTLHVLIKYGLHYLILSPFQALRVKPLGAKKWVDVSQGQIDTTQPYRCFIKDPSGKKRLDQYIDLFFYNGCLSKEIAFGDLLKDGNTFCDRFIQFYQESKGRPQLIHIATDGETYGHHKKFGDMALAYSLKKGFSSRGFQLINYGSFLRRFPPICEVEIDEGLKGEGTSCSCAHGVGRWKEDCGCSTGGRPGWNQNWRKPLREALDLLRDELGLIFDQEGGRIFKDVWEARKGYIDVILDPSDKRVKRFFEQYGIKGLSEKERIQGLKLLEMQRHALQMYTSCGWFFADLAGLETKLILQHAARAIQLSGELGGQGVETQFVEHLSGAKSNLPEMGDGRQVFERLVKLKCVTWDHVVNHFAISSLFEDGLMERKIFSFRVAGIQEEKVKTEKDLMVLGQVKVTSAPIPEKKEFLFGLIFSEEKGFRTWISEYRENLSFDILKEKGHERIGRGEEEIAKALTSLLGGPILTFRDTFKELRQPLFQKLIQNELAEHCRMDTDFFDRTKRVMEGLGKEGLKIPCQIRLAAELALSDRLYQAVKELKGNFKAAGERGEIERIVREAREHHLHLRKGKSLLVLKELLIEKIEGLRGEKGMDPSHQLELIKEGILLLDLVKKWGFGVSVEEAQNLMAQILDECVEGMEKGWWGEGVVKPFPLDLITLAEKLGFNAERFLDCSASNRADGERYI